MKFPPVMVDCPGSGSIWYNRQNIPLFVLVAHTTANTANAKNLDHVMFGFLFIKGEVGLCLASFCRKGFTSTFLSSTFLGLPLLSSVENREWRVKQDPEIKSSAHKFKLLSWGPTVCARSSQCSAAFSFRQYPFKNQDIARRQLRDLWLIQL